MNFKEIKIIKLKDKYKIKMIYESGMYKTGYIYKLNNLEKDIDKMIFDLYTKDHKKLTFLGTFLE